jgi:hypothetical protein
VFELPCRSYGMNGNTVISDLTWYDEYGIRNASNQQIPLIRTVISFYIFDFL